MIAHMDEFHSNLLGTDRTYDQSEDAVAHSLNRYAGRL